MGKQARHWIALVLLLSSLGCLTRGVGAEDGAVLSIQPAEGTYLVGETFVAKVRIEDVVDLYGLDVHVAFDPARLQVVGSTITPETELLSPPWLILFKQVDNQAGTIWYVVTLLNPHLPVSGSGALFSLQFRTVAAGSTAVSISEQTLSNINGELIPATTAGATYKVEQGHRLFLPLVLRGRSGGRQLGGAVHGSFWQGTLEGDWR